MNDFLFTWLPAIFNLVSIFVCVRAARQHMKGIAEANLVTRTYMQRLAELDENHPARYPTAEQLFKIQSKEE